MTEIQHHPNSHEASTAELLSQLGDQVTRLVRDELRLAQLELQRKAKRLGLGLGMAGAGAMLGFFAMASGVCAAIAAIALVLPVWAAALIIMAILGGLGGMLALTGRKQAQRGSPPIPSQAIAETRRDIDMIKESTRR